MSALVPRKHCIYLTIYALDITRVRIKIEILKSSLTIVTLNPGRSAFTNKQTASRVGLIQAYAGCPKVVIILKYNPNKSKWTDSNNEMDKSIQKFSVESRAKYLPDEGSGGPFIWGSIK